MVLQREDTGVPLQLYISICRRSRPVRRRLLDERVLKANGLPSTTGKAASVARARTFIVKDRSSVESSSEEEDVRMEGNGNEEYDQTSIKSDTVCLYIQRSCDV